jgi:hypothetical protein
MVTQSRIKELYRYDETTGVFERIKHVNSTKKTGHLFKNGYYRIWVDGKSQAAHRLAWLYVYGYMPKILDHINRNKTDNRICNLREATVAQNVQNRTAIKLPTSGLVGVHKHDGVFWRSRITVNGKTIELGLFKDKLKAKEAYDKAKREHHKFFTFDAS